MATSKASLTMNIEVDRSTFDRLTKLSNELNEPINQVLRRALTELEQSSFMDKVVADFERLMSDPDALQQYNDALAEWK